MYTLDANIYARDIDPNDPNFEDCHALLERLKRGDVSIIVPTLLLAELAASISRVRRDPIRARLVVDALQSLPFMEFVDLDRTLGQAAADIAADRAVKGADAVYIAVAHRYGCTLVTLDQEQAKRAAPIVTVMTPQDVLRVL
ncbi:type II toxin-antitoxin system VapC family toxin [Candidatus Oscillochloris fontis]|uniref:type II toxin-antitoxin system VapC family toxin n=1 Tax=Candidatus Oscillochloris fontis TaxID=2496868 RepID=UPI00101DCB51|nr:PIN domain-containing protein [Candidatus Oscillochloris fontis]